MNANYIQNNFENNILNHKEFNVKNENQDYVDPNTYKKFQYSSIQRYIAPYHAYAS